MTESTSSVSTLMAPVMTTAEAAHQLHMPPATLRYWLEGGNRNGTFYDPVLRREPRGHTDLTWGEFVEARYLRTYRRHTTMQRLRTFVEELRQQFGVPHPLAHFQPYVDTNRDLVFRVQQASGVPNDLLLVVRGHGSQLLLNPLIQERFVDLADFHGGDGPVERLWPMGKRAWVVQDPDLSSAAATVRGVRTSTVRERADAGAGVDELAHEFSLTLPQAHAALSFEWADAS